MNGLIAKSDIGISDFAFNSMRCHMRKLRRKMPRYAIRRRNARRPYMIDMEEFEFADDYEEMLVDWMMSASDGSQ